MLIYAMFEYVYYVFFFKQKTAYEMRISDWSSDVCSSDLESKIEEGERHVWLGSAGRSGLCRPLQHGPHRAPERGNRSRVWRRNCPQGHRDDAGSHDRLCICDHSGPFRSGKRSFLSTPVSIFASQIRPN